MMGCQTQRYWLARFGTYGAMQTVVLPERNRADVEENPARGPQEREVHLRLELRGRARGSPSGRDPEAGAGQAEAGEEGPAATRGEADTAPGPLRLQFRVRAGASPQHLAARRVGDVGAALPVRHDDARAGARRHGSDRQRQADASGAGMLSSRMGHRVIIGVAGAGEEISTRPSSSSPAGSGKVPRSAARSSRRDVPKIVDWYMEGKINIDDLITHMMPVERSMRPST